MVKNRQTLINIVYMVVFTLVFAAISSFVPPKYTGIVFFLYFIVFLGLSLIIPRVRARKTASKILETSGRVLYKVSQQEVMELMTKDPQLLGEAKQFFRKSMMMLIVPLAVWFIVLFLLKPLIIPPTVRHGTTEMFLRYVILYGIFSAIAFGFRITNPSQMPIALTSYEVRERGLVSSAVSLSFPLDCSRYELRYSTDRLFVEIVDKQSNQRIRLYTRDPYELKSILERYAFPSCREK